MARNATLTPRQLHRCLAQFFPAKNDFGHSDYLEEIDELKDFGIFGQDQLVALLERRGREVISIDESPMAEKDIEGAEYFFGKEDVAVRLRENRWFTFSGLLRLAMELEFGESYRIYANNRDGIG